MGQRNLEPILTKRTQSWKGISHTQTIESYKSKNMIANTLELNRIEYYNNHHRTHANSYLIRNLSSRSFHNILLQQIIHMWSAYTLNDPKYIVSEAKHEINFVQHVEVNNTYLKS